MNASHAVKTMLAAALAILAAPACQGPGDSSATPSMVTLAYCCGRDALNPSHDMDAKLLVFEPLLKHDIGGRLVGRLARRWEHSDDYREWTYHLRTDVRWHDGIPFTAHDIAFTIDLMRRYSDPDYGVGAFESVTVHDEHTVTIRSGHARRLYQRWMVFYPKHLLQDENPDELANWGFWKRPVGNGPYRFARLEPLTAMEFEANPDFYLGEPLIKRVVLKFSTGGGFTDLLSGAVDAVPSFPAAELPKIENDNRFRIYRGAPEIAYWVLYWKNDHVLFNQPETRRALTLAIDRRELARLLNQPDTNPIVDGPFTPDQMRRGGLPPPLPYDPAAARALLEANGWRDLDGDGVRERAGRVFRFTLLVRTFSGESLDDTTTPAVYIQSQLRKIGVSMELRPLDPSVVAERFETGDFEAVLSWLRVYEAPWLKQFRFGEGHPVGYENPRAAELIEQASETWVPEEEDRVYAELMEIFRRDLPVTFIYTLSGTSVAHHRLRGLSSPWRVDPAASMDELWLEGGR
jgi:peptide/nickel transport system substrate-binding protein